MIHVTFNTKINNIYKTSRIMLSIKQQAKMLPMNSKSHRQIRVQIVLETLDCCNEIDSLTQLNSFPANDSYLKQLITWVF